jgi:alkyldihydroxyacetonephosphate synthase
MKDNGVDDYIKFQDSIMESINRSGGSLSHHHGVGKMISALIEKHLGAEQMNVLRSIKKHFDPNNIMNPGGQLGFDLDNKKWRDLK